MSQKDHLLQFCQREEYQSLEQAIESHCHTKWLKNLMRAELPSLLELGDSEPDHQKAKEWDEKIKKYMVERGLKTPSQQKNRLVDIRNIIQAVSPDHPVLDDIGFSTEQWREINEQGENKVSDRLTKLIEDPEAVVSIAESLLSSRDWFDLAAALAVLTGRRCAEILKTAKFTYNSLYSVIFTGALKKQEEEIKFEIPTLTEAHKVIFAIQKLREWVDTEEMDNRTINQKYAQSVINACDRHFKELIPKREDKDNLYTHLFRAVYATIAVHWYCPPKVSDLEYRAYIQGHFKLMEGKSQEYKHNIAMERHYYDYKIGNGQGNIDGRLGLKLGGIGVKVLDRFAKFDEPREQRTEKPLETEMETVQQLDLLNPLPSSSISGEEMNKWAEIALEIAKRANIATPEELLNLEWVKPSSSSQPLIEGEVKVKVEEEQPEESSEIKEMFREQMGAISTLTNVMTELIQEMRQTPSRTGREGYIVTEMKEVPVQEKTSRTAKSRKAEEKVLSAIATVMAYNEQAKSKQDKWKITISVLKQLTKGGQSVIERVMKAAEADIEAHHVKHELGKYQNSKGKNAPKVTEDIKWHYEGEKKG